MPRLLFQSVLLLARTGIASVGSRPENVCFATSSATPTIFPSVTLSRALMRLWIAVLDSALVFAMSRPRVKIQPRRREAAKRINQIAQMSFGIHLRNPRNLWIELPLTFYFFASSRLHGEICSIQSSVFAFRFGFFLDFDALS